MAASSRDLPLRSPQNALKPTPVRARCPHMRSGCAGGACRCRRPHRIMAANLFRRRCRGLDVVDGREDRGPLTAEAVLRRRGDEDRCQLARHARDGARGLAGFRTRLFRAAERNRDDRNAENERRHAGEYARHERQRAATGHASPPTSHRRPCRIRVRVRPVPPPPRQVETSTHQRSRPARGGRSAPRRPCVGRRPTRRRRTGLARSAADSPAVARTETVFQPPRPTS
jgi:hypothetical protein